MIIISYIKYGKKEIEYLKDRDHILGKFIEETGFIKREVEKNLYKSLIDSIVGQQISTKAASTIRGRIYNLVENMTPENIDKIDDELLLSCGLSNRKFEYIKDITKSFIENRKLYDNLYFKNSDEIYDVLIKLKGVGKWTVEMLLIHTFNKMDVVSFLDLAVKRGLMKLHNLDELSKEDEEYYKKLYSPYGTVASIYLWEKSKEK